MFEGKLHIVLADDDNDDRHFFQNAFDTVRMQHSFSVFENGYDLMKWLYIAEELPHLIFLDLNMPGKSGNECLKEIRASTIFSDVAVAIYSGSSSPENIEDTLIAGANFYIKKPTDFFNLKKIIVNVLSVTRLYLTDGLNRENFMISC